MNTKRIILESMGIAFVSLFVGLILEKINANLFIPSNYFPILVKAVKGDNTILFLALGVLISIPAALLEELVFRLIPFKLWNAGLNKIVSYWVVGIFMALFFALEHTNNTNGIELPFIQFVLGMYLWTIIKHKGGYWLAVISHFTYNLTCFIIIAAMMLFT